MKDKQWHHLAVVREGGRSRVLVDGAVTAQPPLAAGPPFGDGFEGKLDEIAVFGRALGEVETQRQFQAARR